MTVFDAVILTGGTGERLGGIDKASIEVGRSALIDSVIAAVTGAADVICVGPELSTERPVLWTRENPPGGGPVAGIAAGLELVEAPVVVVLAVDLPFVTAAVVARLVELCTGDDAALVVDAAGTPQPLLAAYRADVLSDRVRDLGVTDGASMHSLIEGLRYATLLAPDAARDVDTPADLERARGEIR